MGTNLKFLRNFFNGNVLLSYHLNGPLFKGIVVAYTTIYFLFVHQNEKSGTTYGADTTNPNLDGKPVLTLAVKTVDAQSNISINYSFINVEDLVDIYDVETDTISQRVLNIANNKISFKLNADTDNALEATATGLKVNVTDKANRDTDATLHNIAYFDATGTPVDAGIASTDVVLTSAIATDAESNEMLQAIFPTVAGGGE